MKGNSAKHNTDIIIMASGNKLMWLSLFLILIGVAGAVYAQVVGHHHAFANTREMPWGMLIGVYAYFAIISTGLCVLAAFSHAFGGNQMAPLANRMVWLSIISLLRSFYGYRSGNRESLADAAGGDFISKCDLQYLVDGNIVRHGRRRYVS